jgi:hypothetical protein
MAYVDKTVQEQDPMANLKPLPPGVQLSEGYSVADDRTNVPSQSTVAPGAETPEERKQRALEMTQKNYAAIGATGGISVSGIAAPGQNIAPPPQDVSQVAGGVSVTSVPTPSMLPKATELPNLSPPQGKVVGGPLPLSTVGQRGQQGGLSLSPQLAQRQTAQRAPQQPAARPTVVQRPRGGVVQADVAGAAAPAQAGEQQAGEQQETGAQETGDATAMQPVRQTVKNATGTTTYATPKLAARWNEKPEKEWEPKDFGDARKDVASRIAAAVTPQEKTDLHREHGRLAREQILKQGEMMKLPAEANDYYEGMINTIRSSLSANGAGYNPVDKMYAEDAIKTMQIRQGELLKKETTLHGALGEAAKQAGAPPGKQQAWQLSELDKNMPKYRAMAKSPEKFEELRNELVQGAAQELDAEKHKTFTEGWKGIVGADERRLSTPEVMDQALNYLEVMGGKSASLKLERYQSTLDPMTGEQRADARPESKPTPAEMAIAAKYNQVSQTKAIAKDQEEKFGKMMGQIEEGYDELLPLLDAYGTAPNSTQRQSAISKFAPAAAKAITQKADVLDRERRNANGVLAGQQYWIDNIYPSLADPNKENLLGVAKVEIAKQQKIMADIAAKQLRLKSEQNVLRKIGLAPEEIVPAQYQQVPAIPPSEP